MRVATSFRAGAALLLLVSVNAPAAPPAPITSSTVDISAVMAQKAESANYGTPDPIHVNVGGDTIGSATPINWIPFADSGNTCGFVNNYDAVCPYTGSTSPDVVYSFTPAAHTTLSIELCNSQYDTKVFVFENTVGNVVACNDDACGADGWKSEIEGVTMTAGNTYYIVVDGYFGDCGAYQMTVSECCGCLVTCPSGASLEGEPECSENYSDQYNTGCNATPPSFSPFPCDLQGAATKVCGTYGGYLYFGLSYRDTDWYSTTLTSTSNVSFCLEGELDSLLGIIDGNVGCSFGGFYDYAFAAPCQEECLNQSLPAGEWWFFVSPSGFGPSAGACGADYVATLTGAVCGQPVSVQASSWGAIKNIYR